MLRQQLDDVRQRIADACRRAGRDPSTVTLIGVTKTAQPPMIQEVVDCGLADVGESHVQEADAKQAAVRTGVRWHLIGHLQRNKARRAVELFDMIHSVDSLELVHDLERHAAVSGKVLSVLIQVNVSGEPTKSGCRPEEAAVLANAAKAAAHLQLTGLMAIPPYTDDPEAARPHFRRLRTLRDALGSDLKLSMGMSNDFEVAIEEGADFVRIGTAIFGARQ